MNKLRPAFLALLVLIFLCALGAVGEAQPSLTHAQPVLAKSSSFTPIVTQIQSLISGATQGDTSSTKKDEDENAEPQETFGTKSLNLVLDAFDDLQSQGENFVSNFTALSQLVAWFHQQSGDPRHLERWQDTGKAVVVVLGISLAVSLVLNLLLLPARNVLRRRKPGDFLRRCVTAAVLFGMTLLPLIAFICLSLILLNQQASSKFARFIVLNIVYALTLGYFIIAIIRRFLSPMIPALRLLPVTTGQAVYAYRWLSFSILVMVYGYFLIDVAHAVRMPKEVLDAFAAGLAFVLVVLAIVATLQKRSFIARVLSGGLTRSQPHMSWAQTMRLGLAQRWHVLAIAYLVLGYGVTALSAQDGFTLMLQGTIVSVVILAVVFSLSNFMEHQAPHFSAVNPLRLAPLRFLLRLVLWGVAFMGMAAGWGADMPALFSTALGQRILGSCFSISVTLVLVTLMYQAFTVAIERHLNRRDAEGNVLLASSRMRTLLPMIRNTVFVVFAVLVGLVVLSELGINIAPLLAGAGVIGVAIGFGSQTLIKDFLTGLFIVVENTIAIGDTVKIGDHQGEVEGMSIRTLRLRDKHGALHILPFSEVSKIINMTRDFAFAVMDVGVAYDSDLEHVMRVIRAVGAELQSDPHFGPLILNPVDVFGVETLGDSSITITSRMRTLPGKQWEVRRMFLLRLKQRFDVEKIVIPFPTVMQIRAEGAV